MFVTLFHVRVRALLLIYFKEILIRSFFFFFLVVSGFLGNCIGSRFALMQIKTLAYYLLSEFVIDRSLKTQDPIQLKRGTFNLEAQNGFWIDLRRRR